MPHQQAFDAFALLARIVDVEAALGRVRRHEKWEALNVVPMRVTEEEMGLHLFVSAQPARRPALADRFRPSQMNKASSKRTVTQDVFPP